MVEKEVQRVRDGIGKVAIYDQNCGICRNFASIVRKLTRPEDVDVVPCGSGIQQKLAPHISLEQCRKAFLFIDETGEVHEGGEAASKVVSLAPGLAPYAALIRSRAGRAVARIMYEGTKVLRGQPPECCHKSDTNKSEPV